MKIKNISITDFKGIVGTLELDFTGPDGNPLDLVVLAGPNGCGKSSVIEACLLSCLHENGLGNLKHKIRYGKNDFNIVAEWMINAGSVITNCTSQGYSFDGETSISSWHTGPGRLILNDSMRTFLLQPIAYFTAWRSPQITGGVTINIGEKDSKRSIVSDETRLVQIKKRIITLIAKRSFENYDKRIPDKADETLNRINSSWKHFYPDRSNDFFFAGQEDNEKFNLFLKRPDLNEVIPVDMLSSGELEIFIFISWFAINDFTDSVVFIDDPELRLHPAWHRIILKVLKSLLPKTQIICATHSEEILDSVYSYQRFTLLHTGDPRLRQTAEQASEA